MKVLYVNHTAQVSGAEEALCDLLAALPGDVDPVVAAPVGALKDRLTAVLGEQFDRIKKLASDSWNAIRTNVIEPVVAHAQAAKQTVTRLVADARTAIGAEWRRPVAIGSTS